MSKNDEIDLSNLSSTEKKNIEKILSGADGGESDDKKGLLPLPNKKPKYDNSSFSRDMLLEKKMNLEEHLGVLEESLIWAINDVDIFEKKFELNPAKKVELIQAVENIGKEIEMVTEEIKDVQQNL